MILPVICKLEIVETTLRLLVLRTDKYTLLLPTFSEAQVIDPPPASVVVKVPEPSKRAVLAFCVMLPVTASTDPPLTVSVEFAFTPKVRLAIVVVVPEFKVGWFVNA